MYDYLIIGAGLYGSVFAELATSAGKKCLVIDKRHHIGGNCYTTKVENINVHTYGPHIFHTNSDKVWNYVNKFAPFKQFTYSPVANYRNELYSLPFNMWTFHQLWGVKSPNEALAKMAETQIPCKNPTNVEDYVLSVMGKDVYEKLIYGYTKKQWMREPRDLPAFIIKRLPFRLTYDARYFDDKYCAIPQGGYTQIFEKMLSNIPIELSVDYLKDRDYWDAKAKSVIYTGKIDEFFEFKYGELEYRTLDFKHDVLDVSNHQGSPVVNWTSDHVPWTRTIESKHFENIESSKTVVTTETPAVWNKQAIPYYPINNVENDSLYKKYQDLENDFPNHLFGGRLAKYKYYDMDQVIASAMVSFERYQK